MKKPTTNGAIDPRKIKMGLNVIVYRSNALGDCTNGGISSKYDTLTVVNVEGPFEPSRDRPAVMLVQGPGAQWNANPIIVPAIWTGDGWREAPGPFMAGGNFADTSDSRFADAIQALGGTRGMAPKIHDRQEK